MGAYHTVVQGEYLSKIARAYGFADYKTIWDAPENQDLKDKRKNPNVLFPGDKVFIPDKEKREESAATEKQHLFETGAQELVLRVKLLNLSEKPIERILEATTAVGPSDVSPQKDLYEIEITEEDETVELKAKDSPALDLALVVGGLDPVKEVPGQQDRFNNLGYFAGFSKTPNPDQFRWAVEEFQCDHKADGLKVTGICDEEKTQKVLVKKHGV
ncbi:MAG TPA: LysM peptidoglycan-binding domain-containing protein [Verrucomicrobiae bacterium]|nr:LysM peptidoglycan-binding domain-containing protein [Verrucomicrobiae bacterium]